MTASEPAPELQHDEFDSPLGRLTLVADAAGHLRLLGWLEGHERIERALATLTSGTKPAVRRVDNPHGLRAALEAYFAGQLGAIDRLPVLGDGTPFQRRVWSALREIPRGETWSYSQLARRI